MLRYDIEIMFYTLIIIHVSRGKSVLQDEVHEKLKRCVPNAPYELISYLK